MKSPVDADALGRRWAERCAEDLEGTFAATTWPDLWPRSWAGPELLALEPDEGQRQNLFETASHAAAERWLEIVAARRDSESFDDDEGDEETRAVHLLKLLQPDLPRELTVDRDGQRVFLLDHLGREHTVRSLANAWRVVAEWEESRR